MSRVVEVDIEEGAAHARGSGGLDAHEDRMAMSDFQLSLIAAGRRRRGRRVRLQQVAGTQVPPADRAGLRRRTHADVLLEPRADGRRLPLPPGAAPATDERIEPVDLSAHEPPPEAASPRWMAPAGGRPGAPLVASRLPTAWSASRRPSRYRRPQLWQASGEICCTASTSRCAWLGWNESRALWQRLQSHSALTAANGALRSNWRTAAAPSARRNRAHFSAACGRLADRYMAVTEYPDRAGRSPSGHRNSTSSAPVWMCRSASMSWPTTPRGFAGTKLRGIAEAAGMQLGRRRHVPCARRGGPRAVHHGQPGAGAVRRRRP